ncbi:hypothetical protein [Pseudalkalibacillus hwajinpoensis]|uniref:hypothetical protein n=1 Tax=Guptibacillus hwajinpoensis TaxID=208199 RepID=UPI001CD7BEEE|nr:hypothetical protein [Pseudalkalibacillus hwajinpoensis]MCA0990000.1 hypothetical protein [Pseudalkalibacillus hwajinpoensis]
MAKLKRLASKIDSQWEIKTPVSENELSERNKDYQLFPSNRFATKHRNSLFQKVLIHFNDEEYNIQMNCCISPYCKNFGLSQVNYDVKGKPRRYRMDGSTSNASSKVLCNPDPIKSNIGVVLGCSNRSLSNWSVAEEIKRLTDVNSTATIESEYVFHKEECELQNHTPFENKCSFWKRGKSSSNSQKYQCKHCRKITNVLPSTKESTTYHQKRNDILPLFANLITNRTPVNRVIEILNIGSLTYYHNLE